MKAAELALEILILLAPVLSVLVGWLALKLRKLADAKIKNEYARGAFQRLLTEVADTVRAIEQVFGGQGTPQAKKAAALSLLKEHIGTHGLKDLARVLGLNGDALDSYLSTKIESAVAGLPPTGSKPAAALPKG